MAVHSSQPLLLEPFDGPAGGQAPICGSKSHTNRALVCAALASGRSRLTGVLKADDTFAMLEAVELLGAEVEWVGETAVVVTGREGPARRPNGADGAERVLVDVNQSGTTSRFLLPVLAALDGRFRLDGDPQLRARPFGPQIEALGAMGANIAGDGLPLDIDGTSLDGGQVTVDGSASSQFLSGLLLAGPLMANPLEVVVDGDLVSKPYVELTLSTMADFGRPVSADADLSHFTVETGTYQACDLGIEPDASAASYVFAAAAITGGTVRVDGLGSSTIQGDLAFVDALAAMGASVKQGDDWTEVTGTGTLKGITIDMRDISDTAQTLAVVAAHAEGSTELTGIGFIRRKETDRIRAVVTELNRLGLSAVETDDGLVVHPGPVSAGVVETYDDHRMAMSFALFGLTNPGISITNPSCVNKTFPDYFSVLESLRPA